MFSGGWATGKDIAIRLRNSYKVIWRKLGNRYDRRVAL